MRLLLNILLWLGSTFIFMILSIIGLPINIVKHAIKGNLSDYFLALAIGEDQRGGSYIYGTEDWTISSYTYYLGVIKNIKFFYVFMLVIDFFPKIFGYKDHCKRAYNGEKTHTIN